MSEGNPASRLPVRQVLNLTEREMRELTDLLRKNLADCLNDFLELSRPVRRRSQYPTLIALGNGLSRVEDHAELVLEKIDLILDYLEAIAGNGK